MLKTVKASSNSRRVGFVYARPIIKALVPTDEACNARKMTTAFIFAKLADPTGTTTATVLYATTKVLAKAAKTRARARIQRSPGGQVHPSGVHKQNRRLLRESTHPPASLMATRVIWAILPRI